MYQATQLILLVEFGATQDYRFQWPPLLVWSRGEGFSNGFSCINYPNFSNVFFSSQISFLWNSPFHSKHLILSYSTNAASTLYNLTSYSQVSKNYIFCIIHDSKNMSCPNQLYPILRSQQHLWSYIMPSNIDISSQPYIVPISSYFTAHHYAVSCP